MDKNNKGYFNVQEQMFDEFRKAADYIRQLVRQGNCASLPEIVQYYSVKDKLIQGWSWTPYLTKANELRFK